MARLDLAGVAQHIVQRGNDRQACFADDADYLHYRQELGEAAMKYGRTSLTPFLGAEWPGEPRAGRCPAIWQHLGMLKPKSRCP